MRFIFSSLTILAFFTNFAQSLLPISSTANDYSKESISKYKSSFKSRNFDVITTQPVGNLRTMAEWEELQAICVTWTGYKNILAQIIQEVQSECEVIILCDDSATAKNELMSYNISLDNISYVPANYNSIWMRDYGGNTVYKNYVDSLILVDWIYNRNRPFDNSSPAAIGNSKNIPVYEMSEPGTDLVHTGGNFMADGFGTGFSSELVDEENGVNGDYNLTNKTPEEVNQLMEDWMGIDRYVKMPVLPYDDIHHIDMHMKLINEETILVGEFPEGISDGPQIEMNIQYIKENFNSVFGTPYKIVRIPMIPSFSGGYPNGNWGEPYYRTYANNLIVNKKILVPTYRTEYDTIGIRILNEVMPGYEVIGIDCDNSPENIISLGGAIHCITKEIGVSDPLLISHQQLEDTYDISNDYIVEALIMHRSGIENANLHYKTYVGSDFITIPMTNISQDNWSAQIPAQNMGSEISYYISATSNSGKNQVRPITAPNGYFQFKIANAVDVNENDISFGKVFPNPSKGLTCIEVKNNINFYGELGIFDLMGKKVKTIHSGFFYGKNRKYFVDVSDFKKGVYFLNISGNDRSKTYPLLVK